MAFKTVSLRSKSLWTRSCPNNNTERPIAYASKSLSKAEKHYSQINKEAFALVWGIKKFHTYLFARHFTLRTDHKPLTAIFNPTKATPATTAARLQRYALFLSGFDYESEYRSSTNHCNANGSSRLPLATTEDEQDRSVDSVDEFHVSQFNMLPVTCQHVRTHTQRDSILVQVHEYVKNAWQGSKDPILAPFYFRRNELTVHLECIMWVEQSCYPQNYLQNYELKCYKHYTKLMLVS